MRMLAAQAQQILFGWVVVATVLNGPPRFYTCGNREAMPGLILNATAVDDVLHVDTWFVHGDVATKESTFAGAFFSGGVAL